MLVRHRTTRNPVTVGPEAQVASTALQQKGYTVVSVH